MNMFWRKNSNCIYVFLSLVLLSSGNAYSQKKDSTSIDLPQKHKTFWQFLLRPITRNGADSSHVIISKNEMTFLPYQGKGIRHILVKEFGFEKTFTDTTKEI